MGIDGLMLVIGGVVIVGMGLGFYLFLRYMKKHRAEVNKKINESLRMR